MKIMKFNEVSGEVAERLIADDDWVAEQKLDGTRIMAIADDTGVLFTQDGTNPITHSAAAQHYSHIERAVQKVRLTQGFDRLVFDGEIMIDSGEYHVWDLLEADRTGAWEMRHDSPFNVRRVALEAIFTAEEFDLYPMKIVRQARTTVEKERLFSQVFEEGGEGLVFKRRDHVYEPGNRVSTVLKVKFVKTADVVVTGSTRGRNAAGRETGAFQFAVYDETGRLKPLGSTSAIGKPHVEVGDVIEIAYLYFVGSPVQPRMLKVRPDKAPGDCTLEQFPTYSKAVL